MIVVTVHGSPEQKRVGHALSLAGMHLVAGELIRARQVLWQVKDELQVLLLYQPTPKPEVPEKQE